MKQTELSKQISPVPYWANPSTKLKILLLFFVIEFLITLPWSVVIFSPMLFFTLYWFPAGIVWAFELALHNNPDFIGILEPYLWLGWMLYMSICVGIVSSEKKNLVRSLFIILALLLLLNAAGCQIELPNALQNSPAL